MQLANKTKAIWMLAVISAIAVSFVVPYVLCVFGLDFTDTPYHLYQSRNYLSQPQAVLSYWLINRVLRLADGNVLLARFASVCLAQMAAIIVLLVIKKETINSGKWTVPIGFALFNLLLACSPLQILGYDAISTPLIVCAFSLLLIYHVCPQRLFCLFPAGVICGLSVLARLPNIFIIPFGFFWILAAGLRQRNWAAICKAFFCFGLGCLAGLCAIYLFYPSVSAALGAYRPNSATRTLFVLAYRYVSGFILLLPWFCMIHMLCTVYSALQTKNRGWAISVALASVLIVLWLLSGVPTKPVPLPLRPFGVVEWLFSAKPNLFAPEFKEFVTAAYLYTLCWVVIFVSLAKSDYSEITLLFAILLFSILPISGSDTGIVKIAVAFFLPVLIARYWRDSSNGFRWTLVTALLVVLICVPFQRVKAQFEDRSIVRSRATFHEPLLRDVVTSPERVEYVERICQDSRKRRNGQLFVGKNRFLFDYVLGTNGRYSADFWSSLDNEDYVAATRDCITRDVPNAIYVVPFYPDYPVAWPSETLIEKMLVDKGYRLRVSENALRVYCKDE